MTDRPLSMDRFKTEVTAAGTVEVIHLIEMPGDVVRGVITLVTTGLTVERTVADSSGSVFGHDVVPSSDPPEMPLDARCPPTVAAAVDHAFRQRAKTS